MLYKYSETDIERIQKFGQSLWMESGCSLKIFAQKCDALNLDEKDKILFYAHNEFSLARWVIGGGTTLKDKQTKFQRQSLKLFSEYIRRIPKDMVIQGKTCLLSYPYFQMIYHLLKKDYKKVDEFTKQQIVLPHTLWKDEQTAEDSWSKQYLYLLKNAYPGFWRKFAVLIRKHQNNENLAYLSNLLEDYYACQNEDEEELLLLKFVQRHPNLNVPKELLGFTYAKTKRWYNAISCLEQIDSPCWWYKPNLLNALAFYHEKVREYGEAEKYYRQCLQEYPRFQYALNNLGYNLYRQKKYNEAEKIFLQCLTENRDLPYAANNLIRVYLRTGKNQEAKDFVASGKYKIDKSLVKQVEERPKNSTVIDALPIEGDNDEYEVNPVIEVAVPKQQFTSEKILEDEISARLESGHEVFGQKLKIYRRKGDFYGRQYPCSDGEHLWRLDLLCEDDDENLVIIELKKDSGYDDAYAQIKAYVDYFENHRVPQNKSVSGIICLNSPTPELLARVRQDSRIRLFEYKISYTEIK